MLCCLTLTKVSLPSFVVKSLTVFWFISGGMILKWFNISLAYGNTSFWKKSFFYELQNCNGILLSWLASITSANGNLNLPSELNVSSHLGNLYISLAVFGSAAAGLNFTVSTTVVFKGTLISTNLSNKTIIHIH